MIDLLLFVMVAPWVFLIATMAILLTIDLFKDRKK